VTTDIETAIESFRDAAILPDRWTQALDQIARACHSEGATVVLVPTTRLASCRRRAPRYWPIRMVAARDAPIIAPSTRNSTILALELAVRAASPR